MPYHVITDYGTAKIVADRMDLSARQVDTLVSVWDRVIVDLMKNTKEQISSRGARSGEGWQILEADTIKKKGNSKLLYTAGSKPKYDYIDNDALVRSVTIPGAPFQIRETSNFGFEFGTDRPYAYTHQHGSAARNIPARPFLVVLPKDSAKWNRWVAAHVVKPFENPVNPEGAV